MTPSFSPRHWIKRCVEILNRSRPAPPRKARRRSAPLTLERLETRCVPTSVAPGNYSGTITTNTEFDQAGTYTINGPLAVSSGATLTVGKAGQSINLVIDSGDTLTVRGALNIVNAVPVSIAANYGVTTEILVANGGTMSATGAVFSGVFNGGTAELEVAGNGQITSNGSTFGLSQVYLDPGSIVGTGALVRNTFNDPLYLPASDVQYLSDAVTPANDNLSFQDIDILPGSVSGGQALALNAIGSATTANLRYVFSDLSPATFTVQSGASLTVAPNVSVLIQSGVTLTDDGAMSFGSGDLVTFTSNYGATTNLLVGSGGTLNASGTTFTNNVNLSSYFDLIEVGSGGHLTASTSTFALNEVSLDSGSILGTGDLLNGNTFNNPLYLPASDVQYLSGPAGGHNNLSFEDIGILPGSISSGQTLALNAIGTATTANLRYVFTDLSPSTFTVASGASLTVAPYVNVLIQSGVTLTDDGTMSFGNGDTVTFTSNYGATTKLLVGSGGTLNASGTTFTNNVNLSSYFDLIEVGSGGHLTASGSTFALNELSMDGGSILGADDLVGNTFNDPLYLPASDVQYLSDSANPANDNLSFKDIGILPGSIASGQTLALNAIGSATTANLRYVFTDLSPSTFTVASGASLTVAPYVNVLIQSGVTLTDDGTMSFGNGDTVTFTSNYGATTKLLVGSGGTLNASGTTFTNNVNLSSYFDLIEVSSGGELAASGSTFALNELSMDGGSSATLGTNLVSGLFSIASGATINIANNDFTNIGANGLIAVGDPNATIHLENNYWGTTISTQIDAKIEDHNDDPTRPTVSYSPFLTAHPAQAAAAPAATAFSTGARNVALSATVTSPGVVVNEGTVTFTILNGMTVVGTAVTVNVVNGAASASYGLPAGLGGGAYTIQVVYNGTSNFAAYTDASQSLTINAAVSATAAAAASAGFSGAAQSVSLSATVTSAAGTVNEGTETFTILNGMTVVGAAVTVNVVNGAASASYGLPAGLAGGSYTIQAVYNGTADFAAFTDGSHHLTINAAASATAAAAASATFSGAAQSVNLSATVTSGAGTVNEGTETFTILNGMTTIGTAATVNVVGGAASASYTLPAGTAGGVYTIQAVYNGTADFAAFTDATKSLTINAAASATAAANAATGFSSNAQTVTLSATVTSAAGTVNQGTETFTILNGNTVVGTAVTVNVVNGAASANYGLPAGLADGAYTIQAVYNGAADFLGFTDSTHVLNVSAVTATAASAASATFSAGAQTVGLSATVTSGAGTVNEGTETFTILNGMTTIGTAATVNVVGGAASASYTLPAGTAGGVYTIQAVYNGTVNFLGISDNTHHLTVNAAAATTTAANASVAFNSGTQTVSLSATVTSAAGTVNQGTETFTILNGNTVVGTAVTVNVVNGAASASYTLPAGLAIGPYTIQAVYNGTADFSGFTDATHTLNVQSSVGDVAAEFSGYGVWRYSAAGWKQLTTSNASLLASDPGGDVAAEFPGYGVWRYTDAAGWKQLITANASLLAIDAGGDVFAEFSGYGVWRYTDAAGWKQLTASDASLLAADAGGDVAAEFPGYGVWRYTNAGGWKQLITANASLLAIDAGGDVFAEFSGYGVWRYTNAAGWKQLITADASLLTVDAAGDVFAEYPGYGVWRYTNAAGWKQLIAANASLLAADAGGDVFAEFPGYGVWLYTNAAGWEQTTTANASLL